MGYFAYYSINTLITVGLMLLMIVMALENGVFSRKRVKRFVMCFTLIAIAAGSEWLGVRLDGAAMSTKWLHTIDKCVELSVGPLVPAMLIMCVNDNARGKAVFCVMGLNILLEVLSLFTGWVFYVDSANVYTHGPVYPVYYAFLVAGFAYAIFATLITNRRNQYWHGKVLLAITVTLILGTIPHLLQKELHYDWLVCGIATIMYYMYTLELSAVVDPLTTIFNRRLYEKRIKGIVKPGTVVVFFDVDDFKQINDKRGHTAGDETLKLVASVIRDVYSRYGECYRVGGDEFTVILNRREDMAEKLNTGFCAALDALREKDPFVPTVSVGYGVYNGNIVETVKEADAHMYQYKSAGKNAE